MDADAGLRLDVHGSAELADAAIHTVLEPVSSPDIDCCVNADPGPVCIVMAGLGSVCLAVLCVVMRKA